MVRALTTRADALPALAEVFREYGFEGTSLSLISKATGLGKGSLYNFFPGGKEEMMIAVLADIDGWFKATIFSPLKQSSLPEKAISAMMREVESYFQSGRKVCLVGALGLGTSRDPFAEDIRAYFVNWITALSACLASGSIPQSEARKLAEETVAGIQGAIILSRALDDENSFSRILRHHEDCLLNTLAAHRQPKL